MAKHAKALLGKWVMEKTVPFRIRVRLQCPSLYLLKRADPKTVSQPQQLSSFGVSWLILVRGCPVR